MNIATKKHGNTLVVELTGEIDLVTAEEFRREVDSILDSDQDIRNLVLDLTEVEFIDSSGLGAILGRYRRLNKLGGRMAAVGLRPRVRRLFTTAGLMKILDVFESQAQALRKL